MSTSESSAASRASFSPSRGRSKRPRGGRSRASSSRGRSKRPREVEATDRRARAREALGMGRRAVAVADGKAALRFARQALDRVESSVAARGAARAGELSTQTQAPPADGQLPSEESDEQRLPPVRTPAVPSVPAMPRGSGKVSLVPRVHRRIDFQFRGAIGTSEASGSIIITPAMTSIPPAAASSSPSSGGLSPIHRFRCR